MAIYESRKYPGRLSLSYTFTLRLLLLETHVLTYSLYTVGAKVYPNKQN